MCVTCGCSDNDHQEINGHSHSHTLADGTVITHTHPPEVSTVHAQIHKTTISLEQQILAKNDGIAAQNRRLWQENRILSLNFLSSPGSGKTSLLVRTIKDLGAEIPITVIEGDQETLQDAAAIGATGCPVVQINTGTGCHLDASMVARGYRDLQPPSDSLLAIENVGNLVCPALFDLGEFKKVAILSVTEGEDKPIKYPYLFRSSQVILLNKIDLLPHISFDINRCQEYAKQVNPQAEIFLVSALTGEGMEDWYQWIRNQREEILGSYS